MSEEDAIRALLAQNEDALKEIVLKVMEAGEEGADAALSIAASAFDYGYRLRGNTGETAPRVSAVDMAMLVSMRNRLKQAILEGAESCGAVVSIYNEVETLVQKAMEYRKAAMKERLRISMGDEVAALITQEAEPTEDELLFIGIKAFNADEDTYHAWAWCAASLGKMRCPCHACTRETYVKDRATPSLARKRAIEFSGNTVNSMVSFARYVRERCMSEISIAEAESGKMDHEAAKETATEFLARLGLNK